MKMEEVQDIISGSFIVSFEVRKNGMLSSDYFPDVYNGREPGIPTEQEAWQLAEKFAAKRSSRFDVVNIHVCTAKDFVPVFGYENKQFNKYPD